MKKTKRTKVEVMANVTIEQNNMMEIEPMYGQEIFTQEVSFRARVKGDKGHVVVIPVQEGKMGIRYDTLLDTSCGSVKATSKKIKIELTFPKKLGNKAILDLLKDNVRDITSYLRYADIEIEQPMRA